MACHASGAAPARRVACGHDAFFCSSPPPFNVTNRSTHEHSFEVEGEGLEKALDRTLQPGQPAKLVVDLRAGTYQVYCPVADHEERGMTRPLVVQ